MDDYFILDRAYSFSSVVETKIIHYSSLCYFPLTFFAALTVYRYISGAVKIFYFSTKILLLFTALIFSVRISLPLIDATENTCLAEGSSKMHLLLLIYRLRFSGPFVF